jgi:hypothetical protein
LGEPGFEKLRGGKVSPSKDRSEEDGGLNVYVFVLNDSVDLVDELGLAGNGGIYHTHPPKPPGSYPLDPSPDPSTWSTIMSGIRSAMQEFRCYGCKYIGEIRYANLNTKVCVFVCKDQFGRYTVIQHKQPSWLPCSFDGYQVFAGWPD